MGRNRFQEIFWNLHIPNPAHSTGRVDKVSLLLDHTCSKSCLAFHLGKEVSVDETMVGFRGRVSFKQYCPTKPTKYGLKFFVLADSTTGYVYNFLLYTGGEITSTLPRTSSHLPIPGQFVMALMQDLLDRGHYVYTDRFYTSIPLADTITSRGTGLVGTLVRDMKGLPWEVQAHSFKMRTNEVKAWRHENSLVMASRHEKKQPVCLFSTTFSAAPTGALVGQQRQLVTKPEVFVCYNSAMGGVDIGLMLWEVSILQTNTACIIVSHVNQ